MSEVPPEAHRVLVSAGIEPADVRSVNRLTGGVSGEVLSLATPGRRLVLKRALGKLLTEREWTADVARIRREVIFSRVLEDVSPRNSLAVHAFDPAGFILMTQAPEGTVTWKDQLLRGNTDPATAEAVGHLLRRVHRDGSRHPLAGTLADPGDFESLRVQPFLIDLIARHPGAGSDVGALVDWLRGPGVGLMHGDFSPKNLLIDPGGEAYLIDHEVATWAHPAFDVGFVLTHLLLKAIHLRSTAPVELARRFLSAYGEPYQPIPGALVAALMLARVDARSPATYLDADAGHQVRDLSLGWFRDSASLDLIIDHTEEATACE